MAFGLLTTKWSVLQSNLMIGLAKNSKLVAAWTILHNFVKDKDWDDGFDEDCHNGDQPETTLHI
jgi:hypothetical protein